MKSAEFLELDEGIASYAKSKWSSLKDKAAGMFRTPAEKEQAAVEKSSTRAKELGSTAFKSKLKTAFKSAISSGAVSVAGVPEAYSYDSLNRLVENQIIFEAPAATVEQWMTRYMAALTRNYVLTPEDKTRLAELIQEFSTGVTGPDSFPEQAVDKLWDHVWQIGSSQERDERGKIVKPAAAPAEPSEIDQYGPPKANDTLELRGNTYTYDQAKNEWSSTRGPVQKPESIQALNKAYHEQPKPAAPAAASSFDKYGLPKSDAIVDIKGNEYYYTVADKKWRDEAGVELSKPEDLQVLNKNWYDTMSKRPKPPRPPRPRPISP